MTGPRENALQVRRQEALADQYAVKAHAAQVEVGLKPARARCLQQQATAAAAQPPAPPRFAVPTNPRTR